MKRPDQIKEAPDQGMGDRVPPGQFLSNKFPVLTYGSEPEIDIATWQIRVFGLVQQEITLNWEQFSQLQWTTTVADFHCVTQWSQLDNTWEGVTFADLVAPAGPKPEDGLNASIRLEGIRDGLEVKIVPWPKQDKDGNDDALTEANDPHALHLEAFRPPTNPARPVAPTAATRKFNKSKRREKPHHPTLA